MANFSKMYVDKILSQRNGYQELLVKDIDGNLFKAFNITQITGEVEVGNKVLVNTTAIDRNLGTGGYHIIQSNISNESYSTKSMGHIMKLRYTGSQIDCGSYEEEFPEIASKTSLENLPVIVGGLHSQIVPVICYLRIKDPSAKIVYCMSDGAALPLAFSNLVNDLIDKKYLDSTITFGHAFGGDLESINVYSALLAAKYLKNADYVIVSMGPGIVGSNSKFGFSGIEVAQHLIASNSLHGTSIPILRGSLVETRQRHRVLSHQTKTILEQINFSLECPIPDYIKTEIEKYFDNSIHNFNSYNTDDLNEILIDFPKLSTMGRSFKEDRLIFDYALSSAKHAIEIKENL